MTPAILAAQRAKIWFEVREYPHDPSAPSYGMWSAASVPSVNASVSRW